MLDQIKELKQKLGQVLETKDILDLIKTIDGLHIVLSNANLLVDEIIYLYEQDKAVYFPKCITDQIIGYVRDANAQLGSLLSKDITQIKQLQQNLDKLYALCLQSGIISFGFSSKEILKRSNEAKIDIQNLQEKTGKLLSEFEKKTNESTAFVQTLQNQIDELSQAEKKKITEKSTFSITAIESETQDFKKAADQNHKILAEHIASSNEVKSKVDEIHKFVADYQTKISKLFETSTQTHNDIQKIQNSGTEIKTSMDAELKNSQNLTSQIQAKLESVNQMASQVEAKNGTADSLVAQIQEKKKAADDFYTDVETYKKEMLDVTKKAKSDYTELQGSCKKTVDEYSTKTETIVNENSKYQDQIKELLAEAVSGGLFKVFDQRKNILSKGTSFWKWAVVVSSVLVAGGILIVAYVCEAKPDIIFFVRLAIMIPLAFLMFFAATQYKKERMAEEEYAFKSAISLSLEPYRDLLVRMRKDDQLEADFVKKLMVEVFDNPVMRMFDIEEEEEKICKTIVNYLRKLPSDKAASIIEIATEKVAKQK